MRPRLTLLSTHGLILAALARRGPQLTLRQIGDAIGLTERSIFRIVTELEEAGYLTTRRVGRRNIYELHPEVPLQHPLLADVTFGELFRGIFESGDDTPARQVDLREATEPDDALDLQG